MKFHFYVAAAIVLSGCQHEPPKAPKPFAEYPEWNEYRSCLMGKAAAYAKQEGSPLELGIIASSACAHKRTAFVRVASRGESAAYAQGMEDAARTEDPKLVAGLILDYRSQ
jgi:hypothetical protein